MAYVIYMSIYIHEEFRGNERIWQTESHSVNTCGELVNKMHHLIGLPVGCRHDYFLFLSPNVFVESLLFGQHLPRSWD